MTNEVSLSHAPTADAAKRAADWLVRFNPLHGLNEIEAQAIYDQARDGNFSRIQWLYHNLEQTDPTLLVCVERRTSALVGLDWKVVPRPTAGNEELADEQARAVEEALAKVDNLPDAIEHLGLAFFRGFAHAAPDWGDDGLCRHIDLPDNWNFARDPFTGVWYWNPGAVYGVPGKSPALIPIPDGELVSVTRRLPIDYPATSIFLRNTLGEIAWGQFLERFGIPPAFLTMPDGSTEKDVTRFREAAQAFTDGLAGALPYGSAVHFATEARGQNPFAEFVRHQSELIVLLATGGTLTSLAQSGTGTLAGNAQMDVWREIVSRDGTIIGNALDRGLSRRVCEALFPGQPVLCRFELGRDSAITPAEALDLAAKAKAAGYIIDRDELADATGYTLERDTAGLAAAGGFFNGGAPDASGAHGLPTGAGALPRGAVTPPETDAKPDGVFVHGPATAAPDPAPLANEADDDTGKLDPPENKAARDAFAEDMAETARMIAALLEAPDEELAAAAKKAVDELPDALPEKPKFAAELEEALAHGYADGLAAATEGTEK